MLPQQFALVPQQQVPQQMLLTPQQQQQLQSMGMSAPQVGLPAAGPYADFIGAFSSAFQPAIEPYMPKRPATNARPQPAPVASGYQDPVSSMPAAEAHQSASVDSITPVTKALLAYEKLGALRDKIPDGVFAQMAAQIWYENVRQPVDPNIFMPTRSYQEPEQTDGSRKRPRDDTGRFAPQGQQQPSQQPQSSGMEGQGQPSSAPQMPQQQQQQQFQQPVMTPAMFPHGAIPPGMQLVPLVPVQQPQATPMPIQAPLPAFDPNKVKQRLGISVPQPQQQQQQQPQQQAPQQSQQQQPQQQQQQSQQQAPLQPPQPYQQQQPIPMPFPMPVSGTGRWP
jgi:hypothetical protein